MTNMNDEDTVEGLKQLGLTTYEARVFLALQKLGRGTASEISEITDVPRSQVYGAAEGLEKRGLIETQQSTPTVYRPVPLEQARTQLLERLAQTGAETFDYLDEVQNTEEREERTESIWMISGRDSITSRTVNLVEQTDERLLYAVDDPDLVTPALVDAFAAAADRGVTVVLASVTDAVLEQVDERESLYTYRVSGTRDLNVSTPRLFIADNETVLLSTVSPNAGTSSADEVAFWTSENAFAAVLCELAEAWLGEPFD
jgi:sugar-specific transcriptional regulator TrmB